MAEGYDAEAGSRDETSKVRKTVHARDRAQRQEPARAEALDQQIEGQLAEGVGDEEHGDGDVVVESGHAEIPFEPKETSIADLHQAERGPSQPSQAR